MKNAYILKNLSNQSSPDDYLSLINSFSRRTLSKDEVYIFSMILCDNNIDRDFELFSDESLFRLKSVFLGKTGIFDHVPTGSNQTSRIFFTQVITDTSKKNSLNLPYKYLLAKAYMVKSDKNKDLILEIDAGIKKEISIGCAIKSKICSICGADHKINPCSHIPGQYYDVNNSKKLCYLSLEDPFDAYEWSFVAVPAQPNAGVIKNFLASTYDEHNSNFISSSKISDISKSLNEISDLNKTCILSHSSILVLKNYLSKSFKDAFILKELISDLKSNVYKLLSISQPLLSQASINNIIKNLSYQELKDLNLNLSSKLEANYISTQLPPLSEKDDNILTFDNSMFKL